MPAGEVAASARHPPACSFLIEPASYVEPLDLEKIFSRRAPIQVDLGCGDGTFLLAMAKTFPEKNFLGVERLWGRTRSASTKATQVNNVRVLRMETSYAVRYMLAQASIEAFYLLFPDPWPKRRHQRRRVFTNEFLDAIQAALTDGGTFLAVTDQKDYFIEMKRIAENSSGFESTQAREKSDLPISTFEKKFRDQGVPVYRLELRKTSPLT